MASQKVSAVDPGSHSIKAITCRVGRHGLAVQRFAMIRRSEIDQGLGRELSALRLPLKRCVAGLAGKHMTLRYTEVPPAPDWQLRSLMDLEIEDLSSQAGTSLSADYNILPLDPQGEEAQETVLVAFAKDEALEDVAAEIEDAGGSVEGHIPNCIALYNAYLRCAQIEEDGVVCLVNIGHETTDVAIVRGPDLLCVRSLSHGGRVFDEAISKAFNVGDRKAQELKRDLLDLDPASRGRYDSGQVEKVTLAAGGAGSMIVSAVQSSVAFCRTRSRMPDMKIDRLLLSGGSAQLRGMRGMLLEALRCPVEVFDPFEVVDLSGLDAAEAELLERHRPEAVVALGLAVSKLDDSLYELEILPDRVKRRRRFLQRTVFDIAAVLVALLVLAQVVRGEMQFQEDAQRAYRLAAGQQRRLESVDGETADLIEAESRKQVLAQRLAERARPLHSAILVNRTLAATLPEEGWIEELEVKRAAAGGASGARDAVVVFRGHIKDVLGGDIGRTYQDFLLQFRGFEHPGLVTEVRPLESTQDATVTSFTWEVRFTQKVDAATDAQEER